MATILRDWSYRYPWLYQSIAQTMALLVGGNARLRRLPWQGLQIGPHDPVLDLCCGRGEATGFLLECSDQVVGLDASPNALDRARQDHPQAEYVEALAQQMPFEDERFAWVHTSLALHELQPQVLTDTLREIYRVLKPGGIFMTVDFHRPRIPLMWPGLALFLWIFETETAWNLLQEDLPQRLQAIGFSQCHQRFEAGGSLQVIQAHKRQDGVI